MEILGGMDGSVSSRNGVIGMSLVSAIFAGNPGDKAASGEGADIVEFCKLCAGVASVALEDVCFGVMLDQVTQQKHNCKSYCNISRSSKSRALGRVTNHRS